MADGRPGLVFQSPERGTLYQNQKKLPSAFLYGAGTRPGVIEVMGEFSTVGVFFRPAALKTLFGLDAGELTDTCVALNQVLDSENGRQMERLAEASSTAETANVLSSLLTRKVRKIKRRPDAGLPGILAEIASTSGNVTVKELCIRHQISERSLERKFLSSVGVSPQMYLRIVRFQKSVGRLQEGNYTKLTDVAYDTGYADQSHFIRSFRQFSGFAPKDFLNTWEGVTGIS